MRKKQNGPDGPVAKLSANGLVGTGFASRYRLQPIAGFKAPIGRCKVPVPAKAGTCARDRRALQQLAMNVHVKHSDLT